MSEDIKESHKIPIELLREICSHEYGRIPDRMGDLIVDLVALYDGRWQAYEACQVGYHNLDHALDVALAVARMIAGWNKINKDNPVSEENFLVAMAAAFFHDSGYIKDKGDTQGKGGKFTFTHVKRSMELARRYLVDNSWPKHSIETVPQIIFKTDFHVEPDFSETFSEPILEVVAKMVASADLVAQMADVEYMPRINALFEEFKEGYEVETSLALTARGVKIFKSASEIVNGTKVFYEGYVLPRLRELGQMDNYLITFFGEDRNPYLESIAANLSGKLVDSRTQWRLLGEVLEQQGGVSSEQIQYAISQQQKLDGKKDKKKLISDISKKLLERMNQKFSSERLGEILMEMEAIDPVVLCQGLLAQILPAELLDELSRDELVFLLSVSMLLQNYQKGSRVFNHILEMTNNLLDCEASSILLADNDAGEIVIALPTGPHRADIEGKRLPIDKGLAGWVYKHGQPVSLKNVRQDSRFDERIDSITHFRTRSMLAVPLHVNGEWIGVIEILNKSDDNFTEHDMDILTSLVNIVGSALGSTLAYQVCQN